VPFVGSHPLAGSEKRGPEHGDANLFQGRVTVVTPTPRTDSGAVERTVEFWRALDSRVVVMGPGEHDRAVDMDLKYGIALSEGEQDARESALAFRACVPGAGASGWSVAESRTVISTLRAHPHRFTGP